MAPSLGVAWAVLVLVGAAVRWRPVPTRVLRLRAAGTPDDAPRRPRRADPLERVGRAAVALAGPLRGPEAAPLAPAANRRVGAAVLVAAAAATVSLLAVPAVCALAWALPRVRAQRAERRRLAALGAELPEVVDLYVLAVGAGLTVGLATAAVAARGQGALTRELARVADEVSLGRRLADALEALPERAGEAVRPLVAALVDAERYGAPLGPGLERLAADARLARQRRAEEAARRVPVKLLFPLVVCVLPAFALLTVAPLVAGAVRSLRL